MSRSHEERWATLRLQIDWAAEPWFGFLWTDDQAVADQLRHKALALSHERGRPSLRCCVDSTAGELDPLVPPIRLLREPTEALTWIDMNLVLRDYAREERWERVKDYVTRANRIREATLRSCKGGVLTVMPLGAHILLRDFAPDLFSMRAWTDSVEP